MFHDFLTQSNLLILPLIALGIFFFTFAAVVAHVMYGWRNKTIWNRSAHLPLEDGIVVGTTAATQSRDTNVRPRAAVEKETN